MTSPRFFNDIISSPDGLDSDEIVEVFSFEELLLQNLESLQHFFKSLSILESENTIDQHTPEIHKLYLSYINGTMIDLILAYHSNSTNFDIFTFLKQYIEIINNYAAKESATPTYVRSQIQRWINALPAESFISNDS